MISLEATFLIIGIVFTAIAFLPGYSQVVGKRFGQGFMQGVNKEFDNQFDQFVKMQKKEQPTKKENTNG